MYLVQLIRILVFYCVAILVLCSSDNYTYLNGLQLDQPPQLGTKIVKKIIIDKSNDAGGYVQFSLENLNVTGTSAITNLHLTDIYEDLDGWTMYTVIEAVVTIWIAG